METTKEETILSETTSKIKSLLFNKLVKIVDDSLYLTNSSDLPPNLPATPNALWLQGVFSSQGTLGSLADHQWAYGDNDTLGYNTVYLRDNSGNPETTGAKIELSARYKAATFNGVSFIELDGIHLKYNNSTYSGVLEIRESDHITFSNSTVKEWSQSYKRLMRRRIMKIDFFRDKHGIYRSKNGKHVLDSTSTYKSEEGAVPVILRMNNKVLVSRIPNKMLIAREWRGTRMKSASEGLFS